VPLLVGELEAGSEEAGKRLSPRWPLLCSLSPKACCDCFCWSGARASSGEGRHGHAAKLAERRPPERALWPLSGMRIPIRETRCANRKQTIVYTVGFSSDGADSIPSHRSAFVLLPLPQSRFPRSANRHIRATCTVGFFSVVSIEIGPPKSSPLLCPRKGAARVAPSVVPPLLAGVRLSSWPSPGRHSPSRPPPRPS